MDTEGRGGHVGEGRAKRSVDVDHGLVEDHKGAPSQYIPLQYGLLRGDPGVSFFTRRPVAETIVPRLLNTLLAGGVSPSSSSCRLALALGMMAGLNEGKFIDRLLPSPAWSPPPHPNLPAAFF